MAKFAPGFYDDGAGRRRWYDGTRWGDQYDGDAITANGEPANAVPTNIVAPSAYLSTAGDALRAAAIRVMAPVVDNDPNALWQAVGQPLTRIGAGRYKLTADILYFEKGTISMKAQQIMTHEIFDVDVSQSVMQKARGIGTIILNVVRPTGKESLQLEDVPDFRRGVKQINLAALTARDVILQKNATQTINYSVGMPPGQYPIHAPIEAAPAPVAAATVDINGELGKLAAHRDAGVLSDEEFTAAKRKLLGI